MDKRLINLWLFKKFFPKKFYHTNPTKIPFIARLVEKRFFENDKTFVLPKTEVIRIDEKIEKPADMILPTELVDHFIEKACHRVIMNFCVCRDSCNCKDYPIELGCVFLGDTAKKIHPKIGREATVDEAKEHVRKCREKGLVHFVGRSKLDTFWLGIDPGEKLFVICSCCPCCCIARGVPYNAPKLSENFLKMPGVEVRVTSQCIGCGKCMEDVCFVHAISLQDGKAVINSECRACGRCVEICPQNAIELEITDTNYVKNAFKQLEESVDVT